MSVVRNEPPVRGPGRRGAGSDGLCELPGLPALDREDPDIRHVGIVGFLCPVGDAGDVPAVGRPGGIGVVEVAAADLVWRTRTEVRRGIAFDRNAKEMFVPAIPEPLAVMLVADAGNNLDVAFRIIAHRFAHECEAPPIRRPYQA